MPKKDSANKCSNYLTTVLISHASEVMLKILQARLQQFGNQELPDVQAGFWRDREQEVRLPTLTESWRKQGSFKKHIYFCFMDYTKIFDWMDHNKLWETLIKEMGIPDHFTCLLRNLYVGQEATVRILHGTMDWFKIVKAVHQAIFCQPAYLN